MSKTIPPQIEDMLNTMLELFLNEDDDSFMCALRTYLCMMTYDQLLLFTEELARMMLIERYCNGQN